MNLVFDIGNTCAKAGWFDHGRLTESHRFDSITQNDTMALLSKYPLDAVMVSSVSADDSKLFTYPGNGLARILFLDHTIPLPLKVSYTSPETLGHDRIAAAAGARCLFSGLPILVMDLGTAITVDFVTAEGEFSGGNISPGLHARFKSLHEYTAHLPLVRKDRNYPEFGMDTQTAIAAGVQQGIIFELNAYINWFESRYDGCTFVITGGDADFFVHKLKKPIFAYPDLVLTGLNYILEFNSPVTRQ
jgi:type III pantothenate kinase